MQDKNPLAWWWCPSCRRFLRSPVSTIPRDPLAPPGPSLNECPQCHGLAGVTFPSAVWCDDCDSPIPLPVPSEPAMPGAGPVVPTACPVCGRSAEPWPKG